MARSVAKLKMGFYPLPVSEGAKLRQLLTFSGPASVVDPCVGQGVALNLITRDADVRRYGVELDAERALAASSTGIETIQGNTFDAVAKPESFSLLYLNPPYDSEIGSIGNSRMERLFLEHTFRWLVMEGVLVLVIPFERLHECAGVLSSHFARLNIFRMTDEESVRFRQIAVLGVRRNVRGVAVEEARRQLQRISPYGSFQALPELAPDTCEPYSVPPTGEATLSYRGLPYDLLEDLLPMSGAWKQTLPFLMPREDVATGRPITPLHGGHVGLLCTAGLLNGVFGQGEDRHIARWRSVKHVTSGSVQAEVLPANILAKADRMIVWWSPAKRRQMFYVNSEGKAAELNGRIFPQPPLVWKVSHGELNIRALTGNKRPDSSTKLAVAPFWNLSDDGRVCTGTMRRPDSASVAAILAWERGFYESAFTHANVGRLTRHEGGFDGLWSGLAGKRSRFPLETLIALPQTLAQFVRGERS